MRYYLVYFAIPLFCAEIVISGFVTRLRRSSPGKTEDRISCASAFERCEGNERCRDAIRRLDHRCKVTANRCDADMKDLTRCGQIMDHLFAFGMPKEDCKCPQDDRGCPKRQRKIYKNPCFVAIRHLRNQGMFPKTIDAFDRVIKPETTTTILTSRVFSGYQSAIFSKESQDIDTGKVELRETRKRTLADLDASSIIEPTTTTKASIVRRHREEPQGVGNAPNNADEETIMEIAIMPGERVVPSSGNKVDIPQQIPRHDAKMEHLVEGGSEGPSALNNNEQLKLNTIHRTVSMELEIHEGSPQKNDNSIDFKSIAIMLGMLLAIVILSSLIAFLWSRTNKVIFYKGPKCIQDQRMDDEVYSTIHFLPHASTNS